MNVIYSVKDYVANVFESHPDAASGAIDVVAVQQDDGALRCSPFHVHFGSLSKVRKRPALSSLSFLSFTKHTVKKQVTVEVNGRVVDGVRMKLGTAGEAYFVEQVSEPVEQADYSTSPLPSPISGEDVAASPFLANVEAPSTPSMGGGQPEDEEDAALEQPTDGSEWHDTYRSAQENRPEATTMKCSDSNDRLTWGWGALPIVRAKESRESEGGTEEESGGELPMMVKSASIYFDAVDTETTGTASAPPNEASEDADSYVLDHPSMSLCGHLLAQAESQEDVHRIFSEHIVTFEFFRANPATILANPRLRFFVDGKLSPFNAEMQAYLVAHVLFPYSQRLSVGASPVVQAGADASERRLISSGSLEEDDDATAEEEEDARDEQDDVHEESDVVKAVGSSILERSASCTTRSPLSIVTPALEPVEEGTSEDGTSTQDTASLSSEAYFRKSLQPSQEELRCMGLRVGTNDIAFVLRVQGAGELARVTAKLYVWPVSSKIVVAQVDGAISSSTATGGMFKRKDPSALHPGAVEFYSKLARNGYRIVYVTCHGLSQANLLHTVLRSGAGKEESLALPMGPVLLSPDRLLATNSNEMIDAQDFKVAALDALRALFPREVNPFYAAFGKTQADSIVFTQVGVFPGKVFLVDAGNGRLRHRSLMGFLESYNSLLSRVDAMFPPICSPSAKLPSPPLSGTPLLLPPPKSTASNLRATRSWSSVLSAARDEEQLISEAVASQVRTRSLADEAYNDVNFWRIEPGTFAD
ncbi:hypothetical protein BBJ28_00002360 [Nothophytophthora sp. Chile5]|nr:hypothetical protein BBJ28_00002360 [Nothophytophthora sp. Chile5]